MAYFVHSLCRDKICVVQQEPFTNIVGRSTHRDWDSAGFIFVNLEAGEKYVGEYGIKTSITANLQSTNCWYSKGKFYGKYSDPQEKTSY
jgi:hypothetical protein